MAISHFAPPLSLFLRSTRLMLKQKEVRETLIELLIKKVMPPEWIDEKNSLPD